MSAPSAHRVDELAPFWESVSVHEAGHAVIGVLLGVPVHHVRLDYERVTVLGRWEVVGYTGIGPNGDSADLEEAPAVLFTLAGLEAEALHIANTTGMDLDQARASVQGRHANQGDVNTIIVCLPDSGMDFNDALAWVHGAVQDRWQTITYVAEALREQRYLTGNDVVRLV